MWGWEVELAVGVTGKGASPSLSPPFSPLSGKSGEQLLLAWALVTLSFCVRAATHGPKPSDTEQK